MLKKDLQRFIDAHQKDFSTALKEVQSGKKVSHWMWYIFPQIRGLGNSLTSQYYAINNLEEARQFLLHPILGAHLKEISFELLKLKEKNATNIFGTPDDLKLKSSMTLFTLINESNKENVFQKVLEKFFKGKLDQKTLALIKKNI